MHATPSILEASAGSVVAARASTVMVGLQQMCQMPSVLRLEGVTVLDVCLFSMRDFFFF